MSVEMDSSNETIYYQDTSIRYSIQNNGIASTSKCVIFKRKKTSSPFLQNSIHSDVDNSLKDITLIVNDQKLSAHKNVLASNSEYFDRMFSGSFKETNQETIEINVDVSYENFKTLIGYFYSSVLIITEHNVQDLLICSTMFLLDDVCEACVDYLKSIISVENCVNMKEFSNSLGLDILYSSCLTYMINNFSVLANTQEFLTVNYDEIMLFIKNDDLFAKEEKVYDAVMNWIKHDPATRSKYSPELLWYVRLPLVLNTYHGVNKFNEFHGQKMDKLNSFRMEHRKPFRKGILIISHYPFESSPEWYDASIDHWYNCVCQNCQRKNFQTILTPPRHLCTCILLDDGRLFAAGGFQHNRGMRLANMFNPKTKEWNQINNMKFKHVKPYIIQIGWKVFVIGCSTAEIPSYISNIEYYDLIRRKWITCGSRKESTISLRNGTFVTSVNESIYFISMNKAEMYDTKNDSWHSIPQLPEKKLGAAICTLNKKIYVIGGHFNENYYKSVWVYCTESKIWMPVADMNSPRSFSGAIVMNGLIYVFGGKTDDKSFSNTFEVYCPHENEWVTSIAVMNVDRCYIDAIVIEKNCDLFKNVIEGTTN